MTFQIGSKSNSSLSVRNSTSEIKDEYELAEIVIKNELNSKVYVYTIWSDESTLDNENELGATYIWMYNLQNLYNSAITLDFTKDELLECYSLDEIVAASASAEIEKAIRSEDEFLIKIDDAALNINLNQVLIEREIIELILKAHHCELTKQDLIDFGQLVNHEKSDLEFNDNAFNYLQELAEEVLKSENLTKVEHKYVEKAFETLQLDTSNLPKEVKHKKGQNMGLER
ncbi:MAG: hypothetical protein RR941_06355 [Erysipelotrichaceae bacterium]